MQSRTHLFSPMYPNFAALGGVTEELSGTSDGARRHKGDKPSPPWVCAKCAKKHPAEMGCGETVDEPVVVPDYETLKLYAVRTTDDVGAVLGDCGTVHRNSGEQLGCSKCKEGQRKKRKAAAEAAAAAQISGGVAYYTPYNMHGRYPLMNGQRLAQSFTPLVPPTPPPPPGPSTGAIVATGAIGLLFAGTIAYGIFAKRRRR